MSRIRFHDARRDATQFHGFVDGGKNDVAILRDVNDHSATSEVGDDLIFGRLRLR
jgi:hypothetical protein